MAKKQKGVRKVKVPTTERGVDGFIKNIHEAFASEKRIVFDGDHTTAARILCETTPLFPKVTARMTSGGLIYPATVRTPVSPVNLNKASISAFGERYRLNARETEKFKSRVKKELNDGRGVKFGGNHTEFVRIFQRMVVVRQMTASFIEMIRHGELPEWRKPWSEMRRPRSGRSGERLYTYAPNILLLIQTASEQGRTDPRWITRKYAREIGRPVRNGEIGVPILGSLTPVYNWEQCAGSDYDLDRLPPSPSAQSIMDDYIKREQSDLNLRLFHRPLEIGDADKAFYDWTKDLIVLPHRNRFGDRRQYYLTAFHEIAHSTGHSERLGRPQSRVFSVFGSHRYGREELIAEMTAFLLAMEAGLTSNDPLATFNDPLTRDTAAYLKGWLNTIEENPDLLYEASKGANDAYKYALDMDGFREKTRDQARERKR